MLRAKGINTSLLDDWADRSITRDVSWGIPLPVDLDPEMEGKTLYVGGLFDRSHFFFPGGA